MECREKLIQLQPETQLSDTEVGAQFDKYCDAISSWIHTILDLEVPLLQNLRYLDMMSDLKNTPTRALLPDELSSLKLNPDAQAAFLEAMIHRFLHERLLDQTCFFPGASSLNEEHLKVPMAGVLIIKG